MSTMQQLGLFCAQQNKDSLLGSKDLETVKPWYNMSFYALDVETTGLDAASNRIIELALVPFNLGDEAPIFSELFAQNEALPAEIIKITGIDDHMLEGKPKFGERAAEIMQILEKATFILAYNAKFDRPFVESELARVDMVLPDLPWVDPFVFVCELDRYKKGKKLIDAAHRWEVQLNNAHRALDDAKAAGDLMLKMAEKIALPDLSKLLEKQKIYQWRYEQQLAEYRKNNAWAINR